MSLPSQDLSTDPITHTHNNDNYDDRCPSPIARAGTCVAFLVQGKEYRMSATTKEVFVPGRLCILGEHSDWAGEYRDRNGAVPYGMAIVCATMEGLYARCKENEANRLTFRHGEGQTAFVFDVSLDRDQLTQEAMKDTFFSYVAGTLIAVMSNPKYETLLRTRGLHIDNYKTTLPMKKGLSSSAAACVLVVQCFEAVYGLCMDTSEVMELAYLGEMNTPSRCGRMDQCVSMGPRSIGLMEFNGQHCFLHRLHCAQPLFFVVADLRAGKNTITILRNLNECFPEPSSEAQHSMHRYSLCNQENCWRAVSAIESGDASALAAAMKDAQTLFDNCAVQHCPSELLAPVLRRALQSEDVQRLALAGKGVGSQGDGSMQLLCASAEMQKQVLELLQSPPFDFDAFALTIPASGHIETPEHILIGDCRVDRAVLVCKSTADSSMGASLSHHLFDFMVELVACGVRSISVVCRGENGCSTSCSVCCSTRDALLVSDRDGWSYDEEKRRALRGMVTFCVDSGGDDLKLFLITLGSLSPTRGMMTTSRHNILVGRFDVPVMTTAMNAKEPRPRHQVVYDCLRRPQQAAPETCEVFGTTLVEWGGISVSTSRCVLTGEELMSTGGSGIQAVVDACRMTGL